MAYLSSVKENIRDPKSFSRGIKYHKKCRFSLEQIQKELIKMGFKADDKRFFNNKKEENI